MADAHRLAVVALLRRAVANPTARAALPARDQDALRLRHPRSAFSFMKAAQVGAYRGWHRLNWSLCHSHAPGTMLAVLRRWEMAKRTSRGRWTRDLGKPGPAVHWSIPARSRTLKNRLLFQGIPRRILVLLGRTRQLAALDACRYIFHGRVTPIQAVGQRGGDPVTSGGGADTTFSHRRKVFMVSTPEPSGDQADRKREYEVRYMVPPITLVCPELYSGCIERLALGHNMKGDRHAPTMRGLRDSPSPRQVVRERRMHIERRATCASTCCCPPDPPRISLPNILSLYFTRWLERPGSRVARELAARRKAQQEIAAVRRATPFLAETLGQRRRCHRKWQAAGGAARSLCGRRFPSWPVLTVAVDVKRTG